MRVEIVVIGGLRGKGGGHEGWGREIGRYVSRDGLAIDGQSLSLTLSCPTGPIPLIPSPS